MKLKLEASEEFAKSGDPFVVLTATDSVSAEQIAVLQAGLKKLFQAGKKRMLLDLTALPSSQLQIPEVLTRLIALKVWAVSMDAEFFVASPVENLGDAPGRTEGLALMQSPLGRLMAHESACKLQVSDLEREKAALQSKLAAIDAGTDSILKAKRENSELLKRIELLEMRRTALAKMRRRPLDSSELGARLRSVEATLQTVLAKEGWISA